VRTCDACRPRLAREYANTAKTGLSNHVPMPETPRAAPTDALTRPRSAAQATATSYVRGDVLKGILIEVRRRCLRGRMLYQWLQTHLIMKDDELEAAFEQFCVEGRLVL
jgi:hypothetical protein